MIIMQDRQIFLREKLLSVIQLLNVLNAGCFKFDSLGVFYIIDATER